MRRIPTRGVELAIDTSVELPLEAAHYARDVLRLVAGTRVEVFSADGIAFEGVITATEPFTVHLDVELDGLANESPCGITLYQAIPKKDRFEWLLEKATELGVRSVVPVTTARSVVKVPANKVADRIDRWQKICDGAARQSGRRVSTQVQRPMTLTEALSSPPHQIELALHPRAARALRDVVHHDSDDVAIWLGPEGGFTDDEVAHIEKRAMACTLGPRILRAETAGIAAAAAVQLITGGLD